jgi:hypothetical protein
MLYLHTELPSILTMNVWEWWTVSDNQWFPVPLLAYVGSQLMIWQNNINSDDWPTVHHVVPSGTGNDWLSDSVHHSPGGLGWNGQKLCVWIEHVNTTLIATMPDDGVRDSFWNVRHQLHIDIADQSRRLHYILSLCKLQIVYHPLGSC